MITDLLIQIIPVNNSRNAIWKTMAENINQDTGTPLFSVVLQSSLWLCIFLLRTAVQISYLNSYHKIQDFSKFNPCDCQSYPHILLQNVKRNSNNVLIFKKYWHNISKNVIWVQGHKYIRLPWKMKLPYFNHAHFYPFRKNHY